MLYSPKAPDADVHINARPLIYHPGMGRAWSSVLVADKLFGIEIVNSLIFGGFAAKGEAFSNVLKTRFDGFTQVAGEHAGFGRHVVGVLPGSAHTSTTLPCSTMSIHWPSATAMTEPTVGDDVGRPSV